MVARLGLEAQAGQEPSAIHEALARRAIEVGTGGGDIGIMFPSLTKDGVQADGLGLRRRRDGEQDAGEEGAHDGGHFASRTTTASGLSSVSGVPSAPQEPRGGGSAQAAAAQLDDAGAGEVHLRLKNVELRGEAGAEVVEREAQGLAAEADVATLRSHRGIGLAKEFQCRAHLGFHHQLGGAQSLARGGCTSRGGAHAAGSRKAVEERPVEAHAGHEATERVDSRARVVLRESLITGEARELRPGASLVGDDQALLDFDLQLARLDFRPVGAGAAQAVLEVGGDGRAVEPAPHAEIRRRASGCERIAHGLREREACGD